MPPRLRVSGRSETTALPYYNSPASYRLEPLSSETVVGRLSSDECQYNDDDVSAATYERLVRSSRRLSETGGYTALQAARDSIMTDVSYESIRRHQYHNDAAAAADNMSTLRSDYLHPI